MSMKSGPLREGAGRKEKTSLRAVRALRALRVLGVLRALRVQGFQGLGVLGFRVSGSGLPC